MNSSRHRLPHDTRQEATTPATDVEEGGQPSGVLGAIGIRRPSNRRCLAWTGFLALAGIASYSSIKSAPLVEGRDAITGMTMFYQQASSSVKVDDRLEPLPDTSQPSASSSPASGRHRHLAHAKPIGPLPKKGTIWTKYREMVCIEDLPESEWTRTVETSGPTGLSFEEVTTKKLVVYNATDRADGDIESFQPTEKSTSSRWTLHYRNGPPPDTHEIVDYPAFFVSWSCPAHIFHFMTDTYYGLYSLLKETGALGMEIQLLYNTDPHGRQFIEPPCHGMVYHEFLDVLPVRKEHAAFWKMPSNVCYREGVFGINPEDKDEEYNELAELVLSSLGVSEEVCKDNEVVLVDRVRTRSLLNIQELYDISLSMGYTNTSIVRFEGMTIAEQLQKVHCAKFLLFVHGAVIVHQMFMRRGSTMMQINMGYFPTLGSSRLFHEQGVWSRARGVTLQTYDEWDLYYNPNLHPDKDGAKVPNPDTLPDLFTKNLNVKLNPDAFRNFLQEWKHKQQE